MRAKKEGRNGRDKPRREGEVSVENEEGENGVNKVREC